ncbi:hypothetical protein EDC04DRAFT_2582049, partial [Pisolithus marmoratus]
ERLLGKTHAVVECVIEPWTCMHIHGYTITLRGPLRLLPFTYHYFQFRVAYQPPYNSSNVLSKSSVSTMSNVHAKVIYLDAISGNRDFD